MDDWFNEDEIHNLLGYILHCKSAFNLLSIWAELKSLKTKAEVLHRLKLIAKDILPIDRQTGKLFELNYEDHKPQLFNLFFMLDIAKCLPIGKDDFSRYNFSYISNENWSIEHIFPQNTKDFKSLKSFSKDDLIIIKELVPKNLEAINSVNEDERFQLESLVTKIWNSTDECLISADEQPLIESLLKITAGSLHKIGNLAYYNRE